VSLQNESLGGYFELELPVRAHKWLTKVYKFNSARSAVVSLIDQLSIREVWLPSYLCDSLINALYCRVVELKFYDLTDDFAISSQLTLGKHSLLLYVNYFGLCAEQAQDVVSQYGGDKVIIDNSQAMFCPPFESLATVYSPRKFFGVPDGGLLYSDDPRIRQPDHHDDSSEARMGHLISRLVNEPERSYQKYLEAEQTIADLPVLGMSRLTERLLLSVDYEAAKTIRTENACYLHRALGKYNYLKLHFDETTAPLCYPFLPNIKVKNRSTLIKKRVFIPSYWPEVLTRVEEGSFAWRLVTNGLFLPCDQRYNKQDMERLVHLLAIK
jgi:hypothetical protein